MAETKIARATAGEDEHVDFSVSQISPDNASGNGRTTYINTKCSTYLGFYKQIPELSSSIDAKATWTIGKGFTADEVTTMILDTIKGWGKDTFNTILENMIRSYYIYGDAYAEIIEDEEGILSNLKPLDPATIQIVTNEKGIIEKYEQLKGTKVVNEWEPEEIFHLARNRTVDEIHGISIIEKLESIILMRNEAMNDWKRVLHRNIDPLWIFHLDTDDTTEIASFKSKMDALRGSNEQNMYIPKDAVVPELMGTAPNATLSPLQWIENLNNYFYQAVGTPQIILGGSGEFTEASAKIAYLAFQQSVEEEQLFIEEQVLSQLNLVINLEFPASLENELLSDKAKDGNMNIQPSEMTAGEGQ